MRTNQINAIELTTDSLGRPIMDRPVCGLGNCIMLATRVALDIDGVTEVSVCEQDSYSTRWWGTWPIEEDSQFSGTVGSELSDTASVGGEDNLVGDAERVRAMGEISRDDMAASASPRSRQYHA